MEKIKKCFRVLVYVAAIYGILKIPYHQKPLWHTVKAYGVGAGLKLQKKATAILDSAKQKLKEKF